MNTAELVLEYLRTVLDFLESLAWPAVVVLAILAFREEIAAKIRDLKNAKVPGGEASFDTAAREVEQQATRVAQQDAAAREAQESSVAESSQGGGRTSNDADAAGAQVPAEGARDVGRTKRDGVEADGPRPEPADINDAELGNLAMAVREIRIASDFSEPREISLISPGAGVMLGFTHLERAVRAAEVIAANGRPLEHPTSNVLAVVKRMGMGSQVVAITSQLQRLRNEVVHGVKTDVSVAGAQDFINSCEILVATLRSRAKSQLRHPSRPRDVVNLAADL